MSETRDFTITPEKALELLGKPGTAFVDASWYLPAQQRDGRAEFEVARIPGAVYFDIDAVSDPNSQLPHMLPAPDEFARMVGSLGISNEDDIVVYDGPGLFSCARAWWMFRIMGAENVRVLDGGFDRWREAGHPVETGPPVEPETKRFVPKFDAGAVASIEDIRANVKSGKAQILDARPFDRFTGQAPEPRPGLRSGHIPGSKSLPFGELVHEGRLRPPEELRKIFSKLHISPDRKAITSCGSGVTAAVISLALATVDHPEHALYDGSWAEWGQAEDAPVATWDSGASAEETQEKE